MTINGFRDLKVWQASIAFTKAIYVITREFPKSETYGLSSQMQRAAVSIPSNIAEGSAKDSTSEFLRFLSISLGSLAELETQLIIAEQLEYIDSVKLKELLAQSDEIQRMLKGLQKSLKAKLS